MKDKSYIIITIGIVLMIIGRIIYSYSYWPGHEIINMADGSQVCIDGFPSFYQKTLSWSIVFISSGLLMILGAVISELLKRGNKTYIIKKILMVYLIASYFFHLFLFVYNFLVLNIFPDYKDLLVGTIWYLFSPITALVNLVKFSFDFRLGSGITAWLFCIFSISTSILIIKLYNMGEIDKQVKKGHLNPFFISCAFAFVLSSIFTYMMLPVFMKYRFLEFFAVPMVIILFFLFYILIYIPIEKLSKNKTYNRQHGDKHHVA